MSAWLAIPIQLALGALFAWIPLAGRPVAPQLRWLLLLAIALWNAMGLQHWLSRKDPLWKAVLGATVAMDLAAAIGLAALWLRD